MTSIVRFVPKQGAPAERQRSGKTFHTAVSVEIGRFSDAVLRGYWLRHFKATGCKTPTDIRQLCAEAKRNRRIAFPPCDSTNPDGTCNGHVSDEQKGLE